MKIVKWEKKKVDYSKIDFDKRRLVMPVKHYVFSVDDIEIGWMIKSHYRAFIQFENQPLLHLEHDGGVLLHSRISLKDIAIQKKIANISVVKDENKLISIEESLKFSMSFKEEKGIWSIIKSSKGQFSKGLDKLFIADVVTSNLSFRVKWEDAFDIKTGIFEFQNEVETDWLFLAMYPLEKCIVHLQT